MAAKATEEMPRKPLAKNLNAYCAWQAYDEIQKTLERTKAGESLGARSTPSGKLPGSARQAAREAEQPNAPDTQDKTSDKWRYWTLRRMERAFEDGEAYGAAWRDFRTLLEGLLADEDFWQIGNARTRLPHLIVMRQRIDEQNAREKRGLPGVKGAATRRKK